MARKICLVTGTRAEYGLSYPILRAIESHSDLELQLVVTGMHLLSGHGNTIELIKKDGFKIDCIIETLPENQADGMVMANAVGKTILGLTEYVKKAKPDILIAMTDLGFTLATAIVGAHMNIPVVHVHGGEVSGSVDELVRHATTKLSHIHFAASKKSAERIIKMGEEPWRVHVVGAPGLDIILQDDFYDEKIIRAKYSLLSGNYIVLVQHPVSTESAQSGEYFKNTLKAIESFGIQTILIYPNADSGSKDIIEVIESNHNNIIKSYKNLSRKDYLSLLKYASVLVGNSSSGILEAPSFKLPAVNIGSRQYGREMAENVVSVGYNFEDIKSAVNFVLNDKKFKKKVQNCVSPYGDGTAGKKIAEILVAIQIDKKLLEKLITY